MGKKELIVYEYDASGEKGRASAVIFPESIDELKRIIRATDLDIVPRGGGSSLRGGCIPDNSIILDLSKMKNILNLDIERKIVYVEAGILLKELNEELEKFNLELPVDSLSEEISTIGGMIAVNSFGSREIKYRKIRDWVEELEIIDGKGNLRVISKNDASEFAGMEGLTGVIIRAKLKLIEKPARSASILQSDSVNELINQAKKLKLESDVSMIDVLDRLTSSFMGLKYRYHMIIEYESERGKLKNEDYEKIINFKNRVYRCLAKKGCYVMQDMRFFVDKLKDFILFLEEENIPFFGSLGSGVLHPCFKPGEKKMQECLEFARKLRGRVHEKFGVGIQKKEFLDKIEKELVRRIKLRYDPDFKFNISSCWRSTFRNFLG